MMQKLLHLKTFLFISILLYYTNWERTNFLRENCFFFIHLHFNFSVFLLYYGLIIGRGLIFVKKNTFFYFLHCVHFYYPQT